jgi:dTDP-4-amino-4,6-dideoxygalactose transaminase
MGPETAKLEAEFASYVAAPHAVAVSSCTAAMHLALLVAGVGPGDEVITTPYTFCATLEAIEYVRAKPVLADVSEDTLNIDPREVERRITDRTRAVMPVDFAGHPCEVDALRSLADRHGLVIVSDAAHSLSARFRGQPVGSLADLTAFSFYVTKPLSTGEGGMVTTARADWDERLRVLRLHGMDRDAWKRYASARSWYYEVGELGYKYNPTDLQSALGRAQLRRQETFQRQRARIAAAYTEAFADVDEVRCPVVRPHVEHAWHLYVIRFRTPEPSMTRDRVIKRLGDRGIGASVHFIPVHFHPYYGRRCRAGRGAFPVAEQAYEGVLSLPIFPGMSASQVRRVVVAVKQGLIGDAA